MSQYRFATTAVAAMLFAIPSLANKPITPNQNTETPGVDTKFKAYGSVRLDAIYDYSSKNNRDVSLNAEKVRFGFVSTIPNTEYGDIHTKVEIEAKKKEHESTIKLRVATIGFKNWLIGHTDSTFIDSEASPEIINSNSPIGEPNHEVGHLNLVRYTTSINGFTVALATESAITDIKDLGPDYNPEYYKIYHKEPTYVASVARKFSWGHASVRGLSQHLEVNDTDVNKHSGRHACAIQLSGSINIGKDKLVGTFASGNGLGIYGNNIATTVKVAKTNEDLVVEFNKQSIWQVGYTHHWNDMLRSNVIASGVNNRRAEKGFDVDLGKPDQLQFGKTAYDYSINTIAKIANNMDLGAEYTCQTRHILAEKKIKDHKAIISFVAHF